MNELIKKLSWDRIKINWNKNPIKMSEFLNFLTVKTEVNRDNLGYSNGWTERTGPNNLIVKGGRVSGIEYLDGLLYKKNLHNPYNNYVTVFYLFEIMTEEGKQFFIEYYKEDIQKEVISMKNKIEETKKSLEFQEKKLLDTTSDLLSMGVSYI